MLRVFAGVDGSSRSTNVFTRIDGGYVKPGGWRTRNVWPSFAQKVDPVLVKMRDARPKKKWAPLLLLPKPTAPTTNSLFVQPHFPLLPRDTTAALVHLLC